MLRASFERLGIRHDLADGYARTALLALADYAGGREFYLPRAVTLRASIRDVQIRREFNGRNLVELASRYQLTTAHVRKILKARTRSKRAPIS
ncbi:MAG: Mor transcription activator family protein [Burkholderiales bacterium]